MVETVLSLLAPGVAICSIVTLARLFYDIVVGAFFDR